MKNNTRLAPGLGVVITFAAGAAFGQGRIYVDAGSSSPTPDGQSWATAFSDLQDALDLAATTSDEDDVWIAQGTYRPSRVYSPGGNVGGQLLIEHAGTPTGNLVTFQLPDGVHLYGGFATGDTSLHQRNPDTKQTILDGDLDGNDPSDKTDNAWHVLIAGDDVAQTGVAASLHTLTVRNGYAAGPATQLAFGNSNFRYTHDYGGAMVMNFNSTVLVDHVKFVGNWANSDGGALFYNNSDVTIDGSKFESNACGFRGGALEGFSIEDEVGENTGITRMRIVGSTFKGNRAGVFGGAIVGEGTLASQDSLLKIEDCYFTDNYALEGGAVVIDSLNVEVRHCAFYGNHADANAGALATTSVVEFLVGSPALFHTTVADSVFTSNFAEGDPTALNAFFGGTIDFASGGGALVTYMRGILAVEGCTFLYNQTAQGEGGALLNGDSAVGGGFVASVHTTVANSTFVGNSAPNGGAIASKSMIGLNIDGWDGLQNRLEVTDSTFDMNRAGQLGGAVYLDGTVGQVLHNRFRNRNSAGMNGHQMYIGGCEVNGIFSSVDPGGLLASLVAANQLLFRPLALKIE